MKSKAILTSLMTATVVIGIAALSCGKKSSDESSTASETSAVSSNAAALAYPTSLAISAFPTTTSTTLSLATDPSDSTGAAKKAEQDKILTGAADSCVPKIMDQKDQEITAATCYEFDQDMIYGTKNVQMGTKNGKDAAGEACLVSFARAQVKRIVGQVDRSLALAQMALCERKKAGETSQPEVGKEIDLAEHLKKAMPKGAVTSAIMKRLDNASDGAKVFSMTFEVTRPDGVAMTVNFTHSPKDDNNAAYTGVLYTNISETKTGSTQKRLISVMYDRSADKVKYTLRTGRFATDLVATAIGSDGQVDFNTGTDYTATAETENYGRYTNYAQSNDAVSGMMFVSFEGNPTTNEGTFSYWQNPGGRFNERARGMLSSQTYDAATGTLSGCAVSGAAGTAAKGVSIRRSVKESLTLEPTGSLHPFFNIRSCAGAAATTDATGSFYSCSGSKWYVPVGLGDKGTKFVTEEQPELYTRQCFKQNTSGVYEIDTAKTTGEAGYELIETADTTKKITPPTPPTPGAGVKKI